MQTTVAYPRLCQAQGSLFQPNGEMVIDDRDTFRMETFNDWMVPIAGSGTASLSLQ